MKNNKVVSEDIKNLYNKHLHTTRTFRRKPFRARKKFEGFENDDNFRHYEFLVKWFKKHPDINIQLFFEASLYFNRNEEFIPIKFYATKTQALTNYTQYCYVIDGLNLDNKKSLLFCLESFKYIQRFCIEKNIDPRNYLTYKEEGDCYPKFWLHVKGYHVCKYSLFVYEEYYNEMRNLYRESEAWGLFIGNLDFSPIFYKERYLKSNKFKKTCFFLRKKLEEDKS